MTIAVVDSGSFRDPGGRVFSVGDSVLRAVYALNAPAYEQARDSGLIDALVEQKLLLSSHEVERARLGPAAADAVHVLEHPRLPFISYPYEWSFSLHRAAALLQLDLMLTALKRGFTLSDATAYNVQFDGTRPVFIDHLSLTPYRDGELWAAHRQFCMQFLNPLILWARLGIQPNAWFRGSLEGIAPEDVAPLLKLRHKFNLTLFSHVLMQGWLQKRSVAHDASRASAPRKLAKPAFVALLQGLRDFIAGLRLGDTATVWGNYAHDNSYADAEALAKRAFVADMVGATKPALLFDFGCNSGDYSEVALDAGAGRVVGFDYDQGALERAYHRFRAAQRPMLPLWLDAANPSPSQGWAQSERKGLAERGRADALIALAFIHHIVIGRNVPLSMALDWLIAMAPVGIIEFPPKSDPMVQRLLAHRPDIFPDYDEAHFLSLIEARARIVRQQHLSDGGRLLIWYDRT